ncbi:MAG: tetratricopeptide repeat protein [Hyphomonadaceae bacterium]|nr:tetratricopeptide repeat protein [Hyphomonadaceae bacterium]
MQSFGKTMRNSLPAIGLGLISAFGLAGVMAVAAPAAIAQQPQVKAKKEFVDNFNLAQAALVAKNYPEAVAKANAAQPHAADNQQKCVLDQIRAASYFAQKQHALVIAAAESAMSLGCLTPDQQKNYKQMLAGAYAETGNADKAMQLTKEFIDQYGGDPTQLAYVARDALGKGQYDDAVKFAERAIEQLQKDGKPPNATYYNIILNAHQKTNNLDEYYKTLERVAPLLNSETYWRPLIERAKREPKFKAQEAQLDIYRTLSTAGVKLNPNEQREMAELALSRGMSIESEQVFDPLFKAGTLGGATDQNAERNKKLYATAQQEAKADKSGGLAQSEKEAATKPTGEVYAITGESYLGAGDYAKAAELIQKGLDKGSLEPGVADLIRLRLGIAQYKAGQKDVARKTWSEIRGDNGSAWLAKVWTAISKT